MKLLLGIISISFFLITVGSVTRGTSAKFTSQATNAGNRIQTAESFSSPSPESSVEPSPIATPTSNPTHTPSPTPTVMPSPEQSPTPTPINTPSPTPSPTPLVDIANHVVISEVQILGASALQDFIELYNPTDTDINLGTSGYTLIKRTFNSSIDTNIKVFTSANIIPAHGYFLWANSGYTTIPTTPDVTTTDILSSNSSVALKDSLGNIIDALSWDTSVSSYKEGTEFNPDPIANQSIERKAITTSTQATMQIGGNDVVRGNGFDSNNNSLDFILRSASQPQNSSSPTEIP